VWKRTIEGKVLTFHLAGINNQNFLMRDDETGSFWQQVTGKCISGPFLGQHLELVRNDEMTFALWKQESPAGTVLASDPKFLPMYAGPDWEDRIQKLPTVVAFTAPTVPPRELVVGIELDGTAKAYPVSALQSEELTQDLLASTPLLLALGPDGKSIRAFVRRIPGSDSESDFYRMSSPQWAMMDSATSSLWDFRGCAFSGPSRGKCLEPVSILKDYWFDWQEYHPDTILFRR
jgi:Protein of unknown function (DUF3179)